MKQSDLYLPFKSPPNFRIAEKHRQASLVFDNDKYQDSPKCPCCSRAIEHDSLSIFTRIRKLLFLGQQIPLYFYFLEIIFILLLVNVLISAGFFFLCRMHSDQCIQIYLYIPYQYSNVNTQQPVLKLPVGYGNYQRFSYLFLILLCIYMVVFFLLQIRIKSKLFEVKKRFVSYSNFSIKLVNVKKTATTTDIANMFVSLGYAQIVQDKISIVKRVSQFQQLLEKRKEIKKNMYRERENQNRNKQKKLKQQLQQLQTAIKIYKQRSVLKPQLKTSVAFVTFDSEQRRNQCLKKYQITGLKKAFFKLCTCCSPTAIHSQHISLQPAPAPKDIIWENVQLPYLRTKFKRLFSYIASFILLLISGVAIFYLSFNNQQTLIIQNKMKIKSSIFFGVLTALLIQITNIIIVQIIGWSSNNFEGHMTYTQTKKSMTKKLTLFIFLNTAVIPYAIYAYRLIFDGNNSNNAFNQLIYNVGFIVVGNTLKPILMLLSITRIFSYLNRRKQLKKGRYSLLNQYQANKLFEPPQFPIQQLYSLVTSSLLKTFFFLHSIPTIVVPQLVLNILVLFASRYILLKRSKMPKQITSQLNLTVSKIAQFCIPLYLLGRICFAAACENQCNFQDFGDGLYQLLKEKYTIIQVCIVVLYCILVIAGNLDEAIASIFVGDKLSGSILEDRQKMDLQFDYLNANSIYKLIEENDEDPINFYNNQRLQKQFIEDEYKRKYW